MCVSSPLQGSFFTRNSSRAIQPPPTRTITVLRKIRTRRSCWESPNYSGVGKVERGGGWEWTHTDLKCAVKCVTICIQRNTTTPEFSVLSQRHKLHTGQSNWFLQLQCVLLCVHMVPLVNSTDIILIIMVHFLKKMSKSTAYSRK